MKTLLLISGLGLFNRGGGGENRKKGWGKQQNATDGGRRRSREKGERQPEDPRQQYINPKNTREGGDFE